MLKGKSIVLRPVKDSDIEQLYDFHLDLYSRGDYFPKGITSQTAYLKRFQETGFWNKDEGLLVMISSDNSIVGHIEFFRTVNYLDEYELSYQVYSSEHRGKGIATEAVNLLVRYLFETKQTNRIRLIIHPDNLHSIKLARNCGFTSEGISRGAWFNKGKHQDVAVFSILRDDVIKK